MPERKHFFYGGVPLVVCLPSSKCAFLPIESGTYYADDDGNGGDGEGNGDTNILW